MARKGGARPGAGRPRKTHCVNGHPLEGDNVYLYPDGKRRGCRLCRSAFSLKHWKKEKRRNQRRRARQAAKD